MRITVSIKIMISFLTISVISIFIVGKFSYLKTKQAIIVRTFEQLKLIRIEKEHVLINFFNEINSDLSTISDLPDTKLLLSSLKSQNNDKYLPNYLFGYLISKNYFQRIAFTDLMGNTFYYYPKNKNNADSLKNNEIYIFDNFRKKLSNSDDIKIEENIQKKGNSSILIGKNCFQNKSKLGSIIIEVSYETIDGLIFMNNPHNGLGLTGEVYLVGSDYLMRSSSRFIANSKFETKVKTKGVLNAFENNPGESEIKDYRNVDVFSSYKKLDVDGLHWAILAEIDYTEAMKQISSVETNIIYLSFVISLLLLGIIAALSTSITSPIRKLQAATEKISNGEYGEIINLKSNDEIGDLIEAFNKMSIQLHEQSEKLEYEQVIKSTLVIDSQELERQRLSRELHDGLGQYILAIKLKLDYALSVSENKKNELINETISLITETIKEIREISNNLMPSVLNEYGLCTAIENLANNINKETKLKFDFQYSDISSQLNKKTQIYVFRIIQEALNNTLKYANATKFDVFIVQTEEDLIVKIQDNGIGVDISKSIMKKGNGLTNIKDRVNLLSGKVDFISLPQKGFGINITIPI